MLGVTVLAVGGLKERYLRDACAEYEKRLNGYCRFRLVEIPESKLAPAPSSEQIHRCLTCEGREIQSRIPKGAYIIALCIEGELLSSEALAMELERLPIRYSQVAFVIGSSHGLSNEVKRAAHRRLSMSPMTFPHQLARVLLLEQIYRGFSIAAGTKYHK